MLIEQLWPQHDLRTPLQRLFQRPIHLSYRPKLEDLLYVQIAPNWPLKEISKIKDLSDVVSALQHHYSLRRDAVFPDSYLQAVDEALRLILERTNLHFYGYIASKAGLKDTNNKTDLLHQLTDQDRRSNWRTTGGALEHILRAVLDALKYARTTDLNSSECRLVMETLRPLAQSAVDYNRILAHLSKPADVYPV